MSQVAGERVRRQLIPRGIRSSSVPYLVALVMMVMLAGYLNYLRDRVDPGGFTIFGQAPGVYVPFALFPVVVLLWAAYRYTGRRPLWGAVFLAGLICVWLVHFALIQLHGDPYPHTVWLFIPITAMLIWKPPTARNAWSALVVMAWAAVAIIVLTMTLEKLGAVPQFQIPDKAAIAWENQRYWLPLRDLFDLEGRWPGPFGFNSKTGFMAVFALIVGIVEWRRWGWILVLVAGMTMLLTGGRGVYLTAAAGLAVLVLFSARSPLARIPVRWHVAGAALPVALLGTAFFFSPLSTTGRIGENGIWNAFLDLWRSSMWTGVGQVGVWSSTGRAKEALDAHSIYIQELAKFGLIGFITTYAVLMLGIGLALMAAARAWAAPLAILTIYLVAGITDLLHDGWQSHSTYTLMVCMAVLGAASWLVQEARDEGRPSTSEAPSPRGDVAVS